MLSEDIRNVVRQWRCRVTEDQDLTFEEFIDGCEVLLDAADKVAAMENAPARRAAGTRRDPPSPKGYGRRGGGAARWAERLGIGGAVSACRRRRRRRMRSFEWLVDLFRRF